MMANNWTLKETEKGNHITKKVKLCMKECLEITGDTIKAPHKNAGLNSRKALGRMTQRMD